MEKKMSIVNKFIFLKWVIGILFITGIISHMLWHYGGPDWLFWIGNIAPAVSLLIPGIATIFIPQFSLELVRHLGRARHSFKGLEWEQVSFIQKIYLFFLMFILTAFGVGVLCMSLYMLLNACLPGNECPPIS